MQRPHPDYVNDTTDMYCDEMESDLTLMKNKYHFRDFDNREMNLNISDSLDNVIKILEELKKIN